MTPDDVSGYVHATDLADYGLTPEDVRRRCPWATEYTALDGAPCWLREDVESLLDGDTTR
jgi:hypothetical protein